MLFVVVVWLVGFFFRNITYHCRSPGVFWMHPIRANLMLAFMITDDAGSGHLVMVVLAQMTFLLCHSSYWWGDAIKLWTSFHSKSLPSAFFTSMHLHAVLPWIICYCVVLVVKYWFSSFIIPSTFISCLFHVKIMFPFSPSPFLEIFLVSVWSLEIISYSL